MTGLIIDMLNQKDVMDEPITLDQHGLRYILPLTLNDIVSSLEENGVPRTMAFAVAAVFGASVQTHTLRKSDPDYEVRKFIDERLPKKNGSTPEEMKFALRASLNKVRMEASKAKTLPQQSPSGLAYKTNKERFKRLEAIYWSEVDRNLGSGFSPKSVKDEADAALNRLVADLKRRNVTSGREVNEFLSDYSGEERRRLAERFTRLYPEYDF